MRIGIAQIDGRVGDFGGNAARIVAAARAAAENRADLVVFPELCVTGYPPRDLLCDERFVEAAIEATARLARELAELPAALLGTIALAPARSPGHPGLYDAAVLVRGGRIEATLAKELLPSYDVFHEPRWFVPGPEKPLVEVAGRRVGVLVCEDLWGEGYARDPARALAATGAEVLVCQSASPYRMGVSARRLHHARRAGKPLVYVNAVGAQDELVFDGRSFALDARGERLAALPAFEEAVGVVDLAAAGGAEPGDDGAGRPVEEELFGALVLGVRGFAAKNGIRRAFLGLSGGIDSAVVTCIAREALGPEAVTAVAMPSRYSDPRSEACARELANRLGIGFTVVPIEPLHAAAERVLAPVLPPAAAEEDTTFENVQARLRAIVLMAMVNREGGMLLNTSNKTELSLGYGTLYGDLAGTLCPIGDLTKMHVVALARWLVRAGWPIPELVLTRPPSAELRPDQVDPFDYATISPLVEALVSGAALPEGASSAEVARLRRMIRAAEHKRWQAGIILKVTDRAFGTGRMIPVTRARDP